MSESPSDAGADVLYDVKENIGHVVLNRPQARNALTFEMYDRIRAICIAANETKDLKALVFSGAGGKAFAAGTDISKFRDFTTPEHALNYESRMDSVLGSIETDGSAEGALLSRVGGWDKEGSMDGTLLGALETEGSVDGELLG